MSHSLRRHGLQHARLPCPSLSSRVCLDSCPLSQWCYLTILSSATPFFCLQSFPASESFPMSQLFAWRGQSTGALASASVLPMNTQVWFPLGLTGLISLQYNRLSRVLSEASVIPCSAFLWSNSHICTWLLEKTQLTRQAFVGKVMPLLFNMLSGFVIACFPWSKHS